MGFVINHSAYRLNVDFKCEGSKINSLNILTQWNFGYTSLVLQKVSVLVTAFVNHFLPFHISRKLNLNEAQIWANGYFNIFSSTKTMWITCVFKRTTMCRNISRKPLSNFYRILRNYKAWDTEISAKKSAI